MILGADTAVLRDARCQILLSSPCGMVARLNLETLRMLSCVQSSQWQWNKVEICYKTKYLSMEMTKHSQTTATSSESLEPLPQQAYTSIPLQQYVDHPNPLSLLAVIHL